MSLELPEKFLETGVLQVEQLMIGTSLKIQTTVSLLSYQSMIRWNLKFSTQHYFLITIENKSQGLVKGVELCLNPYLAGWRSELACCRSTLSMSKIKVRRAIKTKAPVRVQVLLTLEGGGVKEQGALALLIKKQGGGRGPQQGLVKGAILCLNPYFFGLLEK